MADLKASELVITERSKVSFASVTGKGVDNYDGDGFIYKVAMKLDKAEKKRLEKIFLAFWEENKSSGEGDKPANWDNLIYKDKDGDFAISSSTAVEINGDAVAVTLLDSKQNLLDPNVYGSMGEGTEGCLGMNMKIYQSGKKNVKEGISLWLSALQILSFVPYSGGGGGAKVAGQFKTTEDEALSDSNEYKGDDKKSKKDKKKKKKDKKKKEGK